VNLCRCCNEDFGSVTAFDAHRVGKHEYPWSPEQEDGRRCLDTEDLKERGWHRDSRGRWRRPIRYEAVLRFRQSRRAPERVGEGF
jgi:hypothetical protein